MSHDKAPTSLIYGLIDPRTLLIRYVGLSSSGLRRPKQHRLQSCPDSYCRRWVKSLQRLELDYEIVVLEAVENAAACAEAECWWIAFGRACAWPLTNVMAGGYPSGTVILERQQRRATRKTARKAARVAAVLERQQQRTARKTAWEAASVARVRSFYSTEEVEAHNRHRKKQYGIPAEIERRCLQFFDENATRRDSLISAVITAVRVTQETATQLYAKWLSEKTACAPALAEAKKLKVQRPKIQNLCFQLFEKHVGSDQLIADVAIEAHVTPKTVLALYQRWLRVSQERGKAALKKDRNALIGRFTETIA